MKGMDATRRARLEGKRLLVLGTTSSEIPLVRRAQQLGVYVIVTDNNLDPGRSPAKAVADEAWDVSWSDQEALAMLCARKGVDGACAGYSEMRVEALVSLCERMGYHCFANAGQLSLTRDKILFKGLCEKYGVPVVKGHRDASEVAGFPVIVKPSDRGGSIGVSIAHDAEELAMAVDLAKRSSLCSRAVIEDYVGGHPKFDAYYAVVDGEAFLVATDDVLPSYENGTERVVQSGWVMPSREHGRFADEADGPLRELIADLRIRNGLISFSGFASPEGFEFFEAGFRLGGDNLSEYVSRLCGLNVLDLFIYFALLGDSSSTLQSLDWELRPQLKCATINVYSKAGVIARISGFSDVRDMPECALALTYAQPGAHCAGTGAMRTKVGMAYFCHESPSVLARCLEQAYEAISVEGVRGEDMVYERVKGRDVAGWWDGLSWGGAR